MDRGAPTQGPRLYNPDTLVVLHVLYLSLPVDLCSSGRKAHRLRFVYHRGGSCELGSSEHRPILQSDRFLTREQDLILCNSHGARFQIENGICVSGPCPGASLEPVELRIDKNQIIADADELNILMKNTIGAVLEK